MLLTLKSALLSFGELRTLAEHLVDLLVMQQDADRQSSHSLQYVGHQKVAVSRRPVFYINICIAPICRRFMTHICRWLPPPT
jgi:hypothetical protein